MWVEHDGNATGVAALTCHQNRSDRLIRKAKDAIKEAVDEDRKEFMARKLFQLEDVLMKSAKRENHSAMIGAIRLQCELAQTLK